MHKHKVEIVEAVQYKNGVFEEMPKWLAEAMADGTIYMKPNGAGVGTYFVHYEDMIGGDTPISNGDYVVLDDGNIDLYREGDFLALFEPYKE